MVTKKRTQWILFVLMEFTLPLTEKVTGDPGPAIHNLPSALTPEGSMGLIQV